MKASANRKAGLGYWISAVLLPSRRSDRLNRVIVALYPNRGSGESLVPAAGASQDLRVLHFLKLAYGVMEHQLDNMAHEVIAERRRLLASLAPGLLHHEIGANISLIQPNLNNLDRLLKTLRSGEGEDEDWRLVDDTLDNLKTITRRLVTVTHGFNNLEKRRPQEPGNLADLMEQVRALCLHRLGQAGVRLDIDDSLNLSVVTDPALLLHVFINIVTNAINAFEEAKDWSKSNRRILATRGIANSPDGFVAVELRNNGPAIPPERLETIFEKGFTTRRSGHGYGLYICRLIIETLEGFLEARDGSNDAEWAVCLHLELPYIVSHHLDIVSEV